MTEVKSFPWSDLGQDGYIKWLRDKVGHAPIYLISVGCIVLDLEGCVLLEKRSDNGKWSFPQGVLEPPESAEEAVIRELKEETSLIVKREDLHFFQTYSGEQQYSQYKNGDEAYFFKSFYFTSSYSGELQPNFESLELKFFSLYELPEKISGTTRRVAREAMARFCGNQLLM